MGLFPLAMQLYFNSSDSFSWSCVCVYDVCMCMCVCVYMLVCALVYVCGPLLPPAGQHIDNTSCVAGGCFRV